MDFKENQTFGSGGLPRAVSRATKASVLDRLRAFLNSVPHGVIDFLRFRFVPWGGARSVDFRNDLSLGSGGWPTAVSNAAEALVLERLRALFAGT